MKKLSVFLAIFPMMASAHPGDHAGFTVSGVLAHVFGEADHAVIAMAVLLVPLVWWAVVRRQR
jgi:hypothetical protein